MPKVTRDDFTPAAQLERALAPDLLRAYGAHVREPLEPGYVDVEFRSALAAVQWRRLHLPNHEWSMPPGHGYVVRVVR